MFFVKIFVSINHGREFLVGFENNFLDKMSNPKIILGVITLQRAMISNLQYYKQSTRTQALAVTIG